MTRVVVIGAGLGGLRVVEELRRAGYAGGLALVGDEHEHPYDRPPLSKEVLRGEHTGPPHLRPVADYAELDVDLRLGRAAVSLDVTATSVTLDDGSLLPYDALVLAPGASPRLLPGSPQLAGLHVLRTYDDALALRADVLREGRVAVVGGGFVGCEVAASARSMAADVDLVELLSGPLVRVLGPQVAGRVAAMHADAGVRLHCGVAVTGVEGEGRVERLTLSNGAVLPARVVVVGLGVLPRTQWLDGSGIDLAADGAIRCDRFGQASAARVWAVGDAAAWLDSTGRQRRIEHWTTAVEQASTVAQNLLAPAEQLVPHTGVPYFWSDQYGSTLQALGEVAPDTELELLTVGKGVIALHAQGDRLLGVVCFDARRHAGRARRLLQAGSDLTEARKTLLR